MEVYSFICLLCLIALCFLFIYVTNYRLDKINSKLNYDDLKIDDAFFRLRKVESDVKEVTKAIIK